MQEVVKNNYSFIFRGQSNFQWRLTSTLKRIFKSSTVYPSELISRFKSGLARIGLYSDYIKTNLEWLQYARHCGLPVPVIDFTYSPYIALFFSFHGVVPLKKEINSGNKDHFVSLYILNVIKLASGYAKYLTDDYFDKNNKNKQNSKYSEFYNKEYEDFLGKNIDKYFKNGFVANALKLIPYPSKSNSRMLKQQGVLLYDTLLEGCVGEFDEWRGGKWQDIEDFIKSVPNHLCENSQQLEPILYKLKIPKTKNISVNSI